MNNSLKRWSITAGAGLLSGLVAMLAMSFLLAILRYTVGLPTPPELIGDRIAPLLGVDRFLTMLGEAGGYDQLKQMGVKYILAGQLGAGAIVGLIYAIIVDLQRTSEPERSWKFGIAKRGWITSGVAVGIVWILTLILLWPNLDTNYRGLPRGAAMITTSLGLLFTYAVFGLSLILAYRLLTNREPVLQPAAIGRPVGRRALMIGASGVVLAIATGGIIRSLFNKATFSYDGLEYKGDNVQPITPVNDFYVVTKNVVDPEVWKAAWRLNVTGNVDTEHRYDFDGIRNFEPAQQEATLMCISNQIAGGLLSNANWTGVPLHTLIEESGPKEGTVEVVLYGSDGYSDTIPFEKAMEPTTMVVYEINGEPLPDRHGYPVRVLVPGYYGEKSVKWVTEIELVQHEAEGFYEQQGWGPNFVIQARSRIDVPGFGATLSLADAPLEIRGVAFAGTKGVQSVEVSTDGGDSWNQADFDYQSTNITWVLWNYQWQPDGEGDYQIVTRATDGEGNVQTSERHGINPNGARGYHARPVTIQA